MHVRHLVDLAGYLVHCVTLSPLEETRIQAAAMQRYWTHGKSRLDRWAHALKAYTTRQERSRDAASSSWRAVRPVIEEILVSDILTRIWSAIAAQRDRISGDIELSPITQSVFLGHAEARSRALRILISGNGGLAESVSLNRLRRRAEQWNDVLVAMLCLEFDATAFAFDVRRTGQLAQELTARSASGAQQEVRSWVQVSLQTAFARGLSDESPNADLHAEIAAAVLAALDHRSFDGWGRLSSSWSDRMLRKTSDVQGLVEQALFSGLPADGRVAASSSDVAHRFDAPSGPRAPRF